MYVRVYSPDGEPFDVVRERADRLILQHGWTQTRPAPAPEEDPEDTLEESPRKRRRKSDPEDT